jgi:hypothetical protein
VSENATDFIFKIMCGLHVLAAAAALVVYELLRMHQEM